MSRGESHDRPDTIIDTDPDTLSRVLGAKVTLTEAVNGGRLTITGDDRAGQRLSDAARIEETAPTGTFSPP
ncbi:SCP-2 sterol transfer family protein [Thermomonospora umbrina]|uniref:SCP-2 sterol transfer family protein n=2 Tax=Thermomonospora umbrina TaxID=111806 RepID=A0A3D9SXE0_9ACTN|nr:SCP-2 sterol transfer family protein [Thermomonospora umbrina]